LEDNGTGQKLRQYGAFLAAGTFFSTVEEFLTIVLLKHDIPSYVFTLIILFPAFLSLVYFGGWVIDNVLGWHGRRDVGHFLFGATLGLMIEWFLIGLSPWSNPSANPVLMAGFQLGMFSFWATVSFAPRLFIRDDAISVSTRRRLLRFYIPYFVFVYAVVFAIPDGARFGPTIILIIFGYYIAAWILVRYIRQSLASASIEPDPERSARKTLASVSTSDDVNLKRDLGT
jgi:hypothetical protein